MAEDPKPERPGRSFEECKREFDEWLAFDSGDALLRLDEEVETWSDDVVRWFIDSNCYTWENGHYPFSREKPLKQAIRLMLAQELHSAVLRKIVATATAREEPRPESTPE